MTLPLRAQRYLKEAGERASSRTASLAPTFMSKVFGGGSEWDRFIEGWAPKAYRFVQACLGPYGKEPLPLILPLGDAMHLSGANASFDLDTGQIEICRSCEGNPGRLLEKMTHEMTHGAVARFPQGDAFYDEGVVDTSVWLMSHAPFWGEHQEAMLREASYNIAVRRERAYQGLSDYDRKRWAGGVYATMVHGPMLLARLRMRKAEGDFTWLGGT